LQGWHEVRFQLAAGNVEDVLDDYFCARCQAADDPGDERAVSAVRQDRTVRRDSRVCVAVIQHTAQPLVPGYGIEKHSGIRYVNEHAVTVISRAVWRIGLRVVHFLGLGGRAGMQGLRGGQHVIECRATRAEGVVDLVEKPEQRGLFTLPCSLIILGRHSGVFRSSATVRSRLVTFSSVVVILG